MKNIKTSLCLFLTLLFGLASFAQAAPPILNYSGQVVVNGTPFTGTAYLKFAFVDSSGQFSYWSHDGTSTNGSEPTGSVEVSVVSGIYTILIGDTQIAGMGEVDEAVFKNHNDVHLRVWFNDGINGFEQITPDRRFASVPYVLGSDGTGDANFESSSNSVTQHTTVVEGGRVLTSGELVRLVATGPENPSGTLILLEGDEVDVVTYSAGQPARLEYSFEDHTFAIPQTEDGLEVLQTLMGPGSIRLTAATGHQTLAILRVRRTGGRAPTLLYGGDANTTSQSNAPAVVSLPKSRTVVRGGATSLFVSASGKNLNYQWKKGNQVLSDTPVGSNPPAGSARIQGANSPTLSLSEAKAGDSGQYTVVISNPDGEVTVSSAVQLIVDSLMQSVPSGSYFINATPETPGHEVVLSDYNVDIFEVKQSYWEEVYAWATKNGYDFDNPGMNTDPNGITQTGEHPIHTVSWYDALKWANARSEKDGFVPCYYKNTARTEVYRKGRVDVNNSMVKWSANGYRLPTEAEWEVAGRGGDVARRYSWGDSPFPSRANYVDTRVGKTTQVGSFPSNGYGLNDMQGNVAEWVWDLYDPETYDYDFKETFDSWSNSQSASLKELYLHEDSLATRSDNGSVALWRTRGAESQTLGYHGANWAKIMVLPFLNDTRVLGAVAQKNYSSGSLKVRFSINDNNFSESIVHYSSGEKFFPSNDSNRSFEAVEVWAERGGYGSSYAAKVAQLSFSEPAPGVMKLYSLDQNFTDSNVVSNSTPLQIPGTAEQATSLSNNNGEYRVVRTLNFDNNYTVGYVTHQVYPGYSAPSYKMAAKIEYLYADATEQNSTELILDQGSGWKYLKHINPNTQKAVSGIKVWISDFVDGVDYSTAQEQYTTVWSQPFAESVNFEDGTTGSVTSGTDYQTAKTVDLSGNPEKISRITLDLRSRGSGYNYPVRAKIQFKYTDGTEANSTDVSTKEHHGYYQATNHINPNPSKEVSQWVLWLDRQSSIYQYNHAYWVNPVAYTDEQTGANAQVGTHYLLGANYQLVKEIELPSPTKISQVYNQLRRTYGSTAYCKIQYHYLDGTEENSTQQSSSSDTFQMFSNYLNPSPEKEVNKISVWLKNNSGDSSQYQAYERNTRYVAIDPEISSGDTYEQVVSLQASSSTFLKLKEITLPEAELLNGVMNEISRGSTGTSYCIIKFIYEDDAELFDSANNEANTAYYSPKWYPNPNLAKKVKRIEVWGKNGSMHQDNYLYERRTSIVRVPHYHMSNPPSYISFRIPQYEETDTHFKVKVDAIREAGDAVWFEIFDGENNQTYLGSDFEKFHALPSHIQKPDKLRIYMLPAPNTNNPQTGISAVYWTTNDPKSVFDGWSGAPTDRVYRGEDYSQSVKEIRNRAFSSANSISNRRGFRLVQRP